MNEVEKAKEVLRANGYYVEEAQKILNIALTNEATMEQISFAITDAIECYFEDELDTDYED